MSDKIGPLDVKEWLSELNHHCMETENVPIWRLVASHYILKCVQLNLSPTQTAQLLCSQRVGRTVPALDNLRRGVKPVEPLPESEEQFSYEVVSPVLAEPIQVLANARQLRGLLPALEARLGYEFRVRAT